VKLRVVRGVVAAQPLGQLFMGKGGAGGVDLLDILVVDGELDQQPRGVKAVQGPAVAMVQGYASPLSK
jgi:hypothetical protein